MIGVISFLLIAQAVFLQCTDIHCTKCEEDINICTECVDSYYPKTGGSSCLKCGITCATCRNSGFDDDYVCVTCSIPLTIVSHKDCVCEDGWYMKVNPTSCEKCPGAPCKLCENSEDANQSPRCIGCAGEFMTLSYEHECKCYTFYYMNADKAECTQCPMKCYACSSDENNKPVCNQCRDIHDMVPPTCDCKPGFTINDVGDDCIECPKNCKVCEKRYNTIYCKTCNDILMSEEKCLCPPLTTISQDSSRCLSCSADSSCLECDDSTGMLTCTQCFDPAMTKENGMCKCPSHFYFKQGCKMCDGRCEECKDAGNSQCISCNADNNAIMKDGKCECRSGYILEGSKCKFNSPMLLFYIIAGVLALVLVSFIMLGVMAFCC
jgi:hypothetical protein